MYISFLCISTSVEFILLSELTKKKIFYVHLFYDIQKHQINERLKIEKNPQFSMRIQYENIYSFIFLVQNVLCCLKAEDLCISSTLEDSPPISLGIAVPPSPIL